MLNDIIKEKIQALQQITGIENVELDNIDLNEFKANDKYYIILNEKELEKYFFEFLLEINETMQLDGLKESEKEYIKTNCMINNKVDWILYTKHQMITDIENRPQLLGWFDGKEYNTIVNNNKYYAYLR